MGPERESKHSPPSTTEIKKAGLFNTTLLYVFMAQCLSTVTTSVSYSYYDNFVTAGSVSPASYSLTSGAERSKHASTATADSYKHVSDERDITLSSNKSALPFWLQDFGLLKNLFSWRNANPSRSLLFLKESRISHLHFAQRLLNLEHGIQNSIRRPSWLILHISHSSMEPETPVNTSERRNI
jgi:hypothetical protein